jgi:hypothetical protein
MNNVPQTDQPVNQSSDRADGRQLHAQGWPVYACTSLEQIRGWLDGANSLYCTKCPTPPVPAPNNQ